MPVEFKDYYKIFGVPRDASNEEIKSAFREPARKYQRINPQTGQTTTATFGKNWAPFPILIPE
jgi:hypothetical protein